MSGIKAGILATWVGPGVNWGRVVAVDRPAVVYEEFRSIDGRYTQLDVFAEPVWVISCASPLAWETIDGCLRFYMSRAAPARYLRPLNPPPESESTLRELDAPVFG